jgi:hypothetical protein
MQVAANYQRVSNLPEPSLRKAVQAITDGNQIRDLAVHADLVLRAR